MNPPLTFLLHSADRELAQRVRGFLHAMATVRDSAEPVPFDSLLRQYHPTLALLDARNPASRDLLAHWQADFPETLILLFAEPDSEAGRTAAEAGVFAVEAPDIDRIRLQTLVRQAQRHLQLVRENRLLKQEVDRRPAAESSTTGSSADNGSAPLQPFTRAFRNFTDVDSMLDSLLEGVVAFAKTARAGIFTLDRAQPLYRLRAGIRCLPGTKALEIPTHDPPAPWMSVHAHIVARTALVHTQDLQERNLLEQMLDVFGAEILIPLQGAQRLLGWLFLGRRINGLPYTEAEIEGLMPLAEHVATSLETALLHEEVALQRSLADTVLFSIPVGVVAVDPTATVRWFNRAAETLLEIAREDILHAPAAHLPGRLGDLLTRVATRDTAGEAEEVFLDPRTQRLLAVVVRSLVSAERCLGAVAIVRDLTRETRLREKEERAERATFWAELAAAISHEVRNPLVAIKTFAQLLPERFNDPEFRTEFSRLTSMEVGRLDGVIEQIHSFANPPQLELKPLGLEKVLRQAWQQAVAGHDTPPAEVLWKIEKGLPGIRGDERALCDGFSHILVNALEAVRECRQPAITIACEQTVGAGEKAPPMLRVTIADNGPGFAPEMKDKAFSPFATTKSRGIGLGLPMAKRTILDHDGRIDLADVSKGARVLLTLPVDLPA